MRAVIVFVLCLLVGAVASAEDEDAAERRARLRTAQTEFDAKEADFVRRVNEAIERGQAWLKSKRRPDGHWPSYKANTVDKVYPGRAALIMLTLSKCGLALKDKDKFLETSLAALENYQTWFAEKAPAHGADGGHTYTQAMLVLMYDAIYAPKAKKRKGRKPKPRAKPKPKRRKGKSPCKWPKSITAKVQSLVQWIESTQEAQIWRYPGPAAQSQDLSNAQYALLALQAAGRCGVTVSPETYRKALAYMLEHQQKHGPEVRLYVANPAWQPGEERYGRVIPVRKVKARGWAYMPGNTPSGSMTAAGVTSLAIIKERLRELGVLTVEERKQIDGALGDGLGWLSKHYAVDKNPGNPSWHYYYLYGLERAGDLLGIQYMGEHAWYREGAEYLIGAQGKDGSWAAAVGDPNASHQTKMIRTCFALLFLKRATVPPEVPVGPVVTGG